MRQAIAKFGAPDANRLQCPVCGSRLALQGACLECAKHHTFDINRHGYVDLRRHRNNSAHYTDGFFSARRWVMQEKGLYSDAIDAIRGMTSRLHGNRIADIGCGDGFITRAVGCFIGLDISLDAIKCAARGGGSTLWVCGDGAHVPIADCAVDMVLNVFAPADYAQFARIAPAGILIKVIPGRKHMWQLRAALGLPQETDSSAQDLLRLRGLEIIDRKAVAQTTRLNSTEEARRIAAMSPVAFSRGNTPVTRQSVPEITTDCTIIAARLPSSTSAERL